MRITTLIDWVGNVLGQHLKATEPCKHEYPLEQAEKQNSTFAQHGDERKSYKGETGEDK